MDKSTSKITDVAVIQMGTVYFWALKEKEKMIATSELIGEKDLIEDEAIQISHQLGFEGTIIIEERRS